MTARQYKLDPAIRKMLDEAGVDWHLENGGKHVKLFIAGRMCAVLPMSGHCERYSRGIYSTRSLVRQRISEVLHDR